ncbi:MAG: virulence factor [Azoarcus sp. PHD]|nr:MAG: virulence factor [Azoarcus sp. PHD]
MAATVRRWPVRLALSLAVFVLCFVFITWGALHAETKYDINIISHHSDLEVLVRLITMPALIATTLFYFSGCSTSGSTESGMVPEGTVVAAQPFRAQVVGVQWMNPLVWNDYSTQWNLLWTLGLASSNVGDVQVKADPQRFRTVQPVASIVSNIGGRKSFRSVFLQYTEEIVRPFRNRYASSATYFYTVQPESPKKWRELAGIHVELGLPDRQDLKPKDAEGVMRDVIISLFSIGGSPSVSSRNTPPDVRVTTGGSNVGFTSLSAALDYLESHPTESVWAMNWDVPEFPLDERMSENFALLILAGPNYDTEREPLAWIGRPVTRNAKDFEIQPSQPRLVQAWRSAMEAAASNAGRPLTDVGYLIHDAGKASDAAGKRIAMLGQALGEPLPEFDILKQGFNNTALMGNTGAGTALTNVALAIAYAHHKGTPVLVAGTAEPDTAAAVVVTPPARTRVFDPAKDWFRARGERNAYLPWWGLRRDVDWSRYRQGYSE